MRTTGTWSGARPVALALACCWAAALGAVAAHAAPPPLKLLTARAGVHQVTWEDLERRAGLSGAVPSAGLWLANLGSPVPIWLEDGRDGSFGPGDWFEFVAETLPGKFGAYHEYSRSNVYVLAFDAEEPARMRAVDGRRTEDPEHWPPPLEGRLHLERDDLLMRFACGRADRHELWYWTKLSCIDPDSFEVTLDLPDLDLRRTGRVTLEIDLHGWSSRQQNDDDVTDHELEIRLNDRILSRQGWSGQDAWRVTLEGIPVDRWRRGENTLSFTVPLRDHPETGDLVVDVTVLNWIALSYPQLPQVDRTVPDRFSAIPPRAGAPIALISTVVPPEGASEPHDDEASAATPIVYRDDGVRIAFPASGGERASALTFDPGRADGFRVAWPDSLTPPAAIVEVVRSDLAVTSRQADYIVITHPTLREAIEPLAAYRRSQGLNVEVVDIRAIYDAFHHGIVHPEAIRAFLRHAYHEWQRPSPRFVLLVGDASWDTRHDELDVANYAFKPVPLRSGGVGRREGPTYRDAGRVERGLIPTWTHVSRLGHSASDNAFACVDGDDNLPDLAIGRLPVVHADDVRAIVEKTIAYERSAGFGPWRRNTLWITNEQEFFQQSTDQVAAEIADAGFVVQRVYPEPGEAGSADRIVTAWDEGQFLVSFYGHGGRNIWRTSPADARETQDLFTLSHLDRLAPRAALPVVLSFTCYSAPFDHPLEDSIGEKLIRLDETGAVAVVAASWRNSPGVNMRRQFVDAFTTEPTAGAALVAAKRRVSSVDAIEMYNLLGDPALALRPPLRALDLAHAFDGAVHTVSGALPHVGPQARVLVEWLDADGGVLQARRPELADGTWRDTFRTTPDAAVPAAVRCYAWDDDGQQSAVGAVAIPSAATAGTLPR